MYGRKAEEIRKRYRYRRLILKGRVQMPVEAARKLIGPDCAYHLYRSFSPTAGRSTGPAALTPGADPIQRGDRSGD